MTREEELDWLYRLRSEIYVYMPKEWLIPMNNALDMAIKKLEQEPTTKNNLAVDCIDRKKLIDWINIWGITPIIKNPLLRHVQGMPSVTPIRPKGHWIVEKGGSYLGIRNACCSNCKDFYTNDWAYMNYCPNCGADMREVEE